jgi:hypothetical protein
MNILHREPVGKVRRSRGRPSKNKGKNGDKKRGRVYAIYSKTHFLKNIDRILEDASCVALITHKITRSQALYKYVYYSVITALVQAKNNQDKFLLSYQPYGVHLTHLPSLGTLSWADIRALADVYAQTQVQLAKTRPNLGLYKRAAIIHHLRRLEEHDKPA